MVLQTVKTSRLTGGLIPIISLLLAFGYTSVVAMCCHLDGQIQVKMVSHGCCHCAEDEAIDLDADDRSTASHDHCIAIELPVGFIAARPPIASAKLPSASVHPLAALAVPAEMTYHSVISNVKYYPPWFDANHQTITLLSTTVLLR
jgi:hypothetical protein